MRDVILSLCLNEVEILSWNYAVYLFLVENKNFYDQLKEDQKNIQVLKFQSADEMILSSALYAKMVNNSQQSEIINKDIKRLVDLLNLDYPLILSMYTQIQDTLDNPVKVHSLVPHLLLHNLFGKVEKTNSISKSTATEFNLAVDDLT